MAEKEVPTYRCTYCLQAIPADYAQVLIGSYHMHPKSDDVQNFVCEIRSLLHYASAAAALLHAARDESDEILHWTQALVSELTDEAARRLQRALDALSLVSKREVEEEKKTRHARKEA